MSGSKEPLNIQLINLKRFLTPVCEKNSTTANLMIITITSHLLALTVFGIGLVESFLCKNLNYLSNGLDVRNSSLLDLFNLISLFSTTFFSKHPSLYS